MSPSELVPSIAIIKYPRLGVYKEDISLSHGLGCQKSKTRKLIYSASSKGLGRWSNMMGTQVIGSSGSQGEGPKGHAHCFIPFTGTDELPRERPKFSSSFCLMKTPIQETFVPGKQSTYLLVPMPSLWSLPFLPISCIRSLWKMPPLNTWHVFLSNAAQGLSLTHYYIWSKKSIVVIVDHSWILNTINSIWCGTETQYCLLSKLLI